MQAEPTSTILTGDCRAVLATMAENSVHCVVTSPPYWGLRSYGTEPLIFRDGGQHCWQHEWRDCGRSSVAGGGFGNERGKQDAKSQRGGMIDLGESCTRCGAWRGHLGLEPTIEMFVKHMVDIFREVRRVLRKDGTAWVNLGDTYSTRGCGLKPKDLCGIPWRVALALQADGWFLRSDIVWQKTNPMPESIRDRPTKSHEYIFLLSKSERYYYDQEAVREPVTGTAKARGDGLYTKIRTPAGWDTGKGLHRELTGRYKPKQNPIYSAAVCGLVAKRNKRTVWTLATQAFKGAHFATFPIRLILPCILAGTSERGVCPTCGAPWKRVVELGEVDTEWQRKCGGDKKGEYHGESTKDFLGHKAQDASATKARILAGMRKRVTTGWKQTCKCPAHEPIPSTVLDPFGGSGTTAKAANEFGRSAILIELKLEYAKMAADRLSQKLLNV